MLTISCFLETVIGIVVRRVDVYRVPKFLQSESSIDHKAFGTTWQGVLESSWEISRHQRTDSEVWVQKRDA
jgi:hypothetical protein